MQSEGDRGVITKKYGYIVVFLVLSMMLTGCSSSKEDVQSYLEEENKIMDKMMEDMHSVENTGNASLDFLYGMIPHHESAVKMSESYLKYADKNAEFKKLAEDIISAQNVEITQMEKMIQEIEKNKKTDPEKEAQYLQEFQTMMTQHHMAHSTEAADLDTAFARGMLLHHQMAVEMAQAVLRYTDEDNVAELARGIVALQEEEIAQMQGFLDQGQGSQAHH